LNNIRKTVEHDLKRLLESLLSEQTDLDEVYLFGSRAYGTGSLRSDCDLLVRPMPGKNVKSSELRDFALTKCEALDFFLAEGGTARSCANDSYVYAESFQKLATRLDATLLWAQSNGFTDFAFRESGSWVFKTTETANFAMTILPDEYLDDQAWIAKIRKVEKSGLSAHPYIGDTLTKAVTFIQEITRRMVIPPGQLGQRGAG
jgi:predicted nucleotidyltransferase